MNKKPDGFIPMKRDSVAVLAVEKWRIGQWLGKNRDAAGASALAYSARKIQALLNELGVEIVDQAGEPYTAGSAAAVVYTEEDPMLPPGHEEIFETVTPTILLNGKLLRAGEVVTHKGAAGAGEEHKP